MTATDTYVETYFVGDPTDATEIEEFEQQAVRAIVELGADGRGHQSDVQRIWAYGDGWGATHEYDEIDGDVHPPPRRNADHAAGP
jgi:hypothetical protein